VTAEVTRTIGAEAHGVVIEEVKAAVTAEAEMAAGRIEEGTAGHDRDIVETVQEETAVGAGSRVALIVGVPTPQSTAVAQTPDRLQMTVEKEGKSPETPRRTRLCTSRGTEA